MKGCYKTLRLIKESRQIKPQYLNKYLIIYIIGNIVYKYK